VRSAAAAAAAYAALIFAAGFVLGSLRVLALAPRLGEVAAVLAEVPVMLALSWLAARRAVARFAVPPVAAARLAMGALAFALLMAAEVALGLWGFGRSVAEVVAGMTSAAGLIGLAGQVGFGLMPLILLAGPGAGR
jgi:hypothetical protein